MSVVQMRVTSGPHSHVHNSALSRVRVFLGLCGGAATVTLGSVTCSSPFCAAAARSTRTACVSTASSLSVSSARRSARRAIAAAAREWSRHHAS